MEQSESLAMAYLTAVQSGDMGPLRRYYAEDVIFDGTVPRWHFSLHARKYLLQRAGIIKHAVVRRPTVHVDESDLAAIGQLVDSLPLRIARK